MSWPYQSPLGSRVLEIGLEPDEAKGDEKGNAVNALCERFSVVRLGRTHRLVGSELSWLCERSNNTRAVKYAKVSGKDVSLFL